MLAIPPLCRTGEDLCNLYPDKIASYMDTEYHDQFKRFRDLGGILLTPEELMKALHDESLEKRLVICLWPDTVKLEVQKLDDDFFATTTHWLTLWQALTPWEIRFLDEVLHLYYAGIIWCLVELTEQ